MSFFELSDPFSPTTKPNHSTTQLDLSLPTSHSTLSDRLLPSTSIFLQSYRPNALATRFPDLLSPAALRSANPNMILATLSAYGAEGSWAGKRGFDSLVQTASGFNHAEGEASGSHAPKPLPVQALDHAAGQLLTFGMLAALARQYTVRPAPRVLHLCPDNACIPTLISACPSANILWFLLL